MIPDFMTPCPGTRSARLSPPPGPPVDTELVSLLCNSTIELSHWPEEPHSGFQLHKQPNMQWLVHEQLPVPSTDAVCVDVVTREAPGTAISPSSCFFPIPRFYWTISSPFLDRCEKCLTLFWAPLGRAGKRVPKHAPCSPTS